MTHPEPPSPVPVQAREYQGRRAGVVSRFVASFVDGLVVVAIVALIYVAIAAFGFLMHPRSFHWPQGLGWSLPLIGFVIVVPYLALSWAATGRTYGDALLGLRVVNWRGGRLRLAGATLRAVLCAAFPIGLVWVAVSHTNRSAQDVLLRTSVIYDWSPRAPAR